MSYASQFQKVKKLLTSITAGDLDRVLVSGGRVYAANGRMMASATFDTDLEFFVDGKTFGSSLVGRNVELSMEDNTVVVRSDKDTNRLASSIPKEFTRPSGDWQEVPEVMVTAFETLAPFQADDRTREWACAITMRDGLTFATNNLIMGVWEGGIDGVSASFPNWLVEYVLSLDAKPTGFIVEELWIGFKFADGTDLRSSRLGREMIDSAIEMGKSIELTETELPKDWYAAVEYVSSLPGCETVTIEPNRIYAETANGSREREIVSPTTKESLWDPAWITKVASIATHLDLDAYPDPAAWHAANVKGLIIGKVR